MKVRRKSAALAVLVARPTLHGRQGLPASSVPEVAPWEGAVRLDLERAAGSSAALRQEQVRVALFERGLSLASEHFTGSHLDRPAVARRLLAHLDALAEAGTTPGVLASLADEIELDEPGDAWLMTLLFSCLGGERAPELLEEWLSNLDPAGDPALIFAAAEALALQPHTEVAAASGHWLSAADPVLASIALENADPARIVAGVATSLGRAGSPLVHVAIERLFARASDPDRRALAQALPGRRLDWHDAALGPRLSWEMARVRLLQGDSEPLAHVRLGDPAALDSLGPHVMDLLALTGAEQDAELARDLALSLETTPALVDAMGRAGYPVLFDRLLGDLADDEHDERAHQALTTALGPRVEKAEIDPWDAVVASLPDHAPGGAGRLRAGRRHDPGAIAVDLQRPELSAVEVNPRLDELTLLSGRRRPPSTIAFGETLERMIAETSTLFGSNALR